MCAEEHSQFKDHVEHAVGAVGLQQLHNVGVFQHVADAGFSLQIWEDRNQTMFTFNKKNHSRSVVTSERALPWFKMIHYV